MADRMTYPAHAKAILWLGLPLAGGHLAQFAIGLTDTVMLGRYGVDALAAITLAHSYFFVLFMLGSGFALAVMPMVAAAVGTGDFTSVRRSTRMGLWLSIAFAVVVMPSLWWSDQILPVMGQEPEVAEDAGRYLRIAGWGLFPALLVMVLKSYLAALEHTRAVLFVTVFGALVNAVANYALIFGNWGAPELGLEGAAIASLVTQSATVLGLAYMP